MIRKTKHNFCYGFFHYSLKSQFFISRANLVYVSINMIMHFNASTQIILHTVIYITHSHLRHNIVDEVTSMDL